MSDAVCIIVPVLRRPQNVEPLIASVHGSTPQPFRLLFVATAGDRSEIAELERCGADWIEISEPGSFPRKINLGYRESSEPLLFAGADDLRFHEGWLDAARARLSDEILVVGTNDLGNRRTIDGSHATHWLFARSYIAEQGGVVDQPPGRVLNEDYFHDYCDDEFISTAKSRGVFAHAPDSHVEHLHWLWGKGEKDNVHRLAMKKSMHGRRLFRQRRRLWA